MSYRKFNKNFLIATVIALGAIAGVQGCSSDDPGPQPSAGNAGKAGAGKAGDTGEAGESNGGSGNNGGGGNSEAGSSPEAGSGGEAGGNDEMCDGFLVPCADQGVTCQEPFDNSSLTKLVDGKVPPLP